MEFIFKPFTGININHLNPNDFRGSYIVIQGQNEIFRARFYRWLDIDYMSCVIYSKWGNFSHAMFYDKNETNHRNLDVCFIETIKQMCDKYPDKFAAYQFFVWLFNNNKGAKLIHDFA